MGIIGFLILGYIGAKWAEDKGYQGGLWFWAVFLGGIIPLYAVSQMEDQRLREAKFGSRDPARIAEGNNLGWVYVRIGIVVSVLVFIGAFWVRYENDRQFERMFTENQAERGY